jgi:hypothetical protein
MEGRRMAQILGIKTAGIASLKSNSVKNGEVARFVNAIQNTKSKEKQICRSPTTYSSLT